MANDRFSKGEAIKFGWEAMKNNFVFFLLFIIVDVGDIGRTVSSR